MKVTITGGAGFIGGNLARRLANDEAVDEVVVVDDLSAGTPANLDAAPATILHVGSILDADLLDRAFDGTDVVVHLAARGSVPRSIAQPRATHDVNCTGTVEVLEAARRCGGPHVIFASSSSVYGANQTLPKHEDLAPRPVSPYASSKLAAESAVLAWAHVYDLPALAFRFFNVFGPLQPAGHDYAAVIPTFIDAALDGRALPIHGDGCQSRDFTFVDSVTGVIASAIQRQVTSPDPVNLAFGTNVSLLEVVNELEEILGHDLARDHLDPRRGDVRASQADQSRLLALFPDVDPVPLPVGLRATIDWFRSQR